MLFYYVTAPLEEDRQNHKKLDREERLHWAEELQGEMEKWKQGKTGVWMSLVKLPIKKIEICACCQTRLKKQEAEQFLDSLGLHAEHIEISEIAMEQALHLIRNAANLHLVADADAVIERLKIRECRYRNNIWEEVLIEPFTGRRVIEKKADELISRSAQEEVARILMGGSRKFMGHPVHYIIETDLPDVRERFLKVLMSALYQMDRVIGLRYTVMNQDQIERYGVADVYQNSVGATVVSLLGQEQDDSEFADDSQEAIEKVGKQLKVHSNSVLSIVCLPKSCEKLKRALYAETPGITFIELKEDVASPEQARRYLAMLAKEKGFSINKSLTDRISDNDKTYTIFDLEQTFDDWVGHLMKTELYPQYAQQEAVSKAIQQEEHAGEAYRKLMGLVGVNRAKDVICQALDYYKAQRLFREKGMESGLANMHMVFTGNPGTAKTTVARLFARIMKDNGVLPGGHLVEVGRADLVGKYVGWTAVQVKKAFEQAKGGVLFIDEAYSLVEDQRGLYGDEAINTIVQEMENHRDELVVVFAGYSKEMETFLSRNPGLRSRIAYQVPFDDYSPEELFGITELLAGEKNLALGEGVREKLFPIFERAARQADFGNGRFARNLLEKARMKQASRLVKMDYSAVGETELRTLLPEDFEAPEEVKEKRKPVIGFVA